MIEEESAALKQKRMEFDFEKATFSKQTEFAKNILKNQDEEIKVSIHVDDFYIIVDSIKIVDYWSRHVKRALAGTEGDVSALSTVAQPTV